MADKKRKKKPAALGCVFWIAFILLIIVLFFFNKKNIGTVLEKTGAADLFSGKKPAVEKNDEGTKGTVPTLATDGDAASQATDGTAEPTVGDGSKEPEKPETAPAAQTKDASHDSGTQGVKNAAPAPATTAATPTQPVAKPTEKPTKKPATAAQSGAAQTVAAKPAAEKAPQTRKSALFFVVIDSDGRVVRKEVTRDIPISDSPLTDALKALLKGPTSAEAAKGYRSLIPLGTQIRSVIVKNGVATVNVSDDFQFNQYGIEGYLGQLSEFVFTATAFSTVKSVQFLIEGQRREYLGAEGVWVGTPLSRDKFN
jgi:spore germination protein GerM